MAAARPASAALPLSLCSRGVFQTTGKAGKDIARSRSFASIKKMGTGGMTYRGRPYQGAKSPPHGNLPKERLNSPHGNAIIPNPANRASSRFPLHPIPDLLRLSFIVAAGIPCPRATRGLFYSWSGRSWRPVLPVAAGHRALLYSDGVNERAS